MKIKLIGIFLALFFLLSACTRTAMQYKEIDLMNADRAFSEYSVKHGLNAAFLKYIDKKGVILRENSMPVEGIRNIQELYKADDSGVQLSWEPNFAAVAVSGELGYTYGTYDLWNKKDSTHSFGTYVSVWKKNAIGQWRVVLDTGNEGLKPIRK